VARLISICLEYEHRQQIKAAAKAKKEEKRRERDAKIEEVQLARRQEVEELLKQHNLKIDELSAFKGEIHRYIEGKGMVNIQQLITMMVGSQVKHKNVWAALDNLTPKQ